MSHVGNDTATVNFGFRLIAGDSLPWHDKEHDNWRVLDALIARYLSLSNLHGVWKVATAYTDGQRVVDPDLGTIWECKKNHTSPSTGTFAAARAADSTKWSAISFQVNAKGTWSSGSTYQVNDFVVNGNIYAAAITAHTAGSTFAGDSGKWAYIVNATSTVAAAQAAADAAASSASTISLPIALTSGGHGTSTASGARAAFGLGTLATQNASSVAVTGGTLTGSTITLSSVVCNAAVIGGGTVSNLSTPLALADGGLAGSTASAGRATLGLGTLATENDPLAVAKGGTAASTASAALANLGGDDFIVVQDQETSGTGGGTITQGAWRTLPLDTEVVDTASLVTISSNQMTLSVGGYYADARANVGLVAGLATGRLRLRNITNSITLTQGANVTLGSGANQQDLLLHLSGSFTLSTTATIELQAWTTSTTTASRAVSTGEVEVYAEVALRRYKP